MKRYYVTEHARLRAYERLGIAIEHTSNHLAQLMQTAYFVGEVSHPDGRTRKLFDHHKNRTRLVIGEDDAIITVYKFPEEIGSQPTSKANAVQIAQIDLELAQLRLEEAKITQMIREMEAKRAVYA